MAELREQKSRKSDTVALVVADENDRILVLWHEKYKFWTVPLGKVEDGEVDINAARREALEELGIQSCTVCLLDVVHKPADLDAYSDIVISLCRIVSFSGSPENMEPHKHRELKFVSAKDICTLGPLSYPTKLIASRML